MVTKTEYVSATMKGTDSYDYDYRIKALHAH